MQLPFRNPAVLHEYLAEPLAGFMLQSQPFLHLRFREVAPVDKQTTQPGFFFEPLTDSHHKPPTFTVKPYSPARCGWLMPLVTRE